MLACSLLIYAGTKSSGGGTGAPYKAASIRTR
jgi:hypothetical protein